MTTLREAIARRIAARKTGVACRTGIGLPDDIWRQALPDADDALAAIWDWSWSRSPWVPPASEAAGYGPKRIEELERVLRELIDSEDIPESEVDAKRAADAWDSARAVLEKWK